MICGQSVWGRLFEYNYKNFSTKRNMITKSLGKLGKAKSETGHEDATGTKYSSIQQMWDD